MKTKNKNYGKVFGFILLIFLEIFLVYIFLCCFTFQDKIYSENKKLF